MKKYIYLILAAAGALSLSACHKTEMCGEPNHPHGFSVNFVNNWDPAVIKPANGMRLSLFALNGCTGQGIHDTHVDGHTLQLPYGAQYKGISYDYYGCGNVAFNSENHVTDCEAYVVPMLRATYTTLFPTENTVAEPSGFFVDKVDLIETTPGMTDLTVDFYPVDAVKTYTFEVRRVRGADKITSTRGAMSGISASYFLATGDLATTSSTVLFDATADGATDKITGSFKVFGLVGSVQNFTIEILFPHDTDGLIQKTFDVSSQLVGGTHIIIDADLDIIPSGSTGSGFETIVDNWGQEEIITVPV